MAARKQRVLTDHGEIRQWAEERKAAPACVRGTGGGGDVGMLRLDFPGYSGETSLEHIDWDEWLDKFDQNNLALLVEDTTARGQKSNFNKLVSRETAQAIERRRPAGRSKAASSRGGAAGRTAAKRGSAAGGRKTSAAKTSAKRAAGRSSSSAKKAAAGRSGAKKTSGSRTAVKKTAARRGGGARKTSAKRAGARGR